MKLLLLSFLLLFNSSTSRGQENLTASEKDSIDLLKLRQKYSTIISYESASFVHYPSRIVLAKKDKRWALIYWIRKKRTKKERLYPEIIPPRYKRKTKPISTVKGDAILSLFIDQQFSNLDTDSLNIQVGSNDSTYMTISHCPTESIYLYHDKKVVEKKAYCLLLSYQKAPNQHKVRFSKCSHVLSKYIEEELNQ